MVILTDEEKQLIDEGKVSYTELIKARAQNPQNTHSVNLNELDTIKQQIKEAMVRYRQSIDDNKDLYKKLDENRLEKEKWRKEVERLRIEKKKALGIL